MRAFAMIALAAVLGGCGRGIPMVGLDESGKQVDERVPAQIYSKKLGETMELVERSTLPVLERQQSDNGFKLRAATVGVGAKGEIGVGALKVSASPKFVLGFTRGKNPPIP